MTEDKPITEEEVAEVEQLQRDASWAMFGSIELGSAPMAKYAAAMLTIAPRLIADWRKLREDLDLTRGAMSADEERLEEAALRVWGEHKWGCDTPDHMADTILALRAHITALEAELIVIPPPNEAAGCIPCFTCGGFRLPGKGCAACAGARERVRLLEAQAKEDEALLKRHHSAFEERLCQICARKREGGE